MNERKPTLWGAPDAEGLVHETMHLAVEEIIDSLSDAGPLPETITVAGYAARTLPAPRAGLALEPVLEWLDEEYGNPEEGTTPTTRMRAAERRFLRTVWREYYVWQYDAVCRREVHVRDWIREHRPDWLEDVVYE